MNRLTPAQLEARLHTALRRAPAPLAPRTLEARVLGEIARRAALPWWRKSFSHWPAPMRVTFVLSSAALLALGVLGTARALGMVGPVEVDAFLLPGLEWVQSLRLAGGTLAAVVQDWLPAVSPTWLYGGLALVAGMYATLIGLGATAYRLLLWQQR
jgi:hypothetical protein